MSAYDFDIAPVAALLAEPSRAAMLSALLAGRALSASELARVAGINAPTASAHLAKLLAGGLVTVVKQGRHRYYALSGPDVADTIETLARLSPDIEPRSLRQSREARALSRARSCYDHLAGQAGVSLHDGLIGSGLLKPYAESYDLTDKGIDQMEALGVDVDAERTSRRIFAGSCLDWTERRTHLNGALAAALLQRFKDLEWLTPGDGRRALRLTGKGIQGFSDTFGILL